MRAFIAAGVVALAAGAAWLQSTRRIGELNRALLGALYGRGVGRSRWYAQDDDGTFPAWRMTAWVLLGLSLVIAWVGALVLLFR